MAQGSVKNERIVTTESPLTAGERAAFIVLTLTAIAGFAACLMLVPWYSPADRPVPRAVFFGILLFFAGSWVVRWLTIWNMRRPQHLPPSPSLRVAVVTTFVPGAEALGMLEQTLRAQIALEYPHDTWVLDEGGDPNVAALCEGLGVNYYTRQGREKYQTPTGAYKRATKYGNYNAWLDQHGYQRYDILAAFDSDHIAEPKFLMRVLGYFRDPGVAFVQAPQVYYNQDASFIARGAAEETYNFYSVHQMASYGAGHPIIVGCHNTHRLTALQQVGGFSQFDADDLVLTLAYRAAGWRGVYVPEILALGLTPVNWYDYLRQQVRWSKSAIEIKLRRLPSLARRLPLTDRVLGLFHGVYYLRPLTILLAYAIVVRFLLTGRRPLYVQPAALAAVAALCLLCAAISRYTRRFFLDPRREGGVHWRAALLQFSKWPYQWLAVWRALGGRAVPYAVTSKTAQPRRRAWILWPHLVIAGVMGVALAAGTWLHGLAPGLTVLTSGLIALSLGLVASERRGYPPPWEPHLYAQRREQLNDVLGPAAWRGPERRRPPGPHHVSPTIERRRNAPRLDSIAGT